MASLQTSQARLVVLLVVDKGLFLASAFFVLRQTNASTLRTPDSTVSTGSMAWVHAGASLPPFFAIPWQGLVYESLGHGMPSQSFYNLRLVGVMTVAKGDCTIE